MTNDMLPKISIVTPSYNQAQYIGWTMRSVLLQRYPNLEYILMDGGSNDGTMGVLAPYRDRLAHLTHARDKGQSDAVSRGFARSTGEIMSYLNSDDMLAPAPWRSSPTSSPGTPMSTSSTAIAAPSTATTSSAGTGCSLGTATGIRAVGT